MTELWLNYEMATVDVKGIQEAKNQAAILEQANANIRKANAVIKKLNALVAEKNEGIAQLNQLVRELIKDGIITLAEAEARFAKTQKQK